jgi:ubiquitin-protein ligase
MSDENCEGEREEEFRDSDYIYEGLDEEDESQSMEPTSFRAFLDGNIGDLSTWASRDTIKLCILSCVRQIAQHPSRSMTIFFTMEELIKNTEWKDFIVFVTVSRTWTVSYTLKFNALIEISKSPPHLICNTYCGRGTFLFPQVLLPNSFGLFVDYGNIFHHLSQLLRRYEVIRGPACDFSSSISSASGFYAIQELAYRTQFRTRAVFEISESGVITGISRNKLRCSDRGIGYAYSNEKIVHKVKDSSYLDKLTALLTEITEKMSKDVINSPILDIIYLLLRELSIEEVIHSPEYASALFGVFASLQTQFTRDAPAGFFPEAAAVAVTSVSEDTDNNEYGSPDEGQGRLKRSRVDENAESEYDDPSEDFIIYTKILLLLNEYKVVYESDYNLDKVLIPSHLLDSTCVEAVSSSEKVEGKGHLDAGADISSHSIVETVDRMFSSFSYSPLSAPLSPSWLKRYRAEMHTLRNNLPANIHVLSSSVDMSCFKFLIIGPADTPYEDGFFIFDMQLPPSYPAISPMVTFKTTGQGTVRFNPNLYNSGKVCLSLLGTWSGEPWNPAVSNINQVLMSICFMIFVAEPYFNEPGYQEGLHSTPLDGHDVVPSPPSHAKNESNRYNSRIRFYTVVNAVLDHLKYPDPDFGDLIIRLLRNKWSKSRETYLSWTKESNQQHYQLDKMKNAILDIDLQLNHHI